MRVKALVLLVFVMGLSTLVLAQEPPIDIGQKPPYNAMTTFVPKSAGERTAGKSLQLVLKYTKDGGSNTQMYALDRKTQVRYNKEELKYWHWCTFVGSVFDQPCEPDKPLKASATITVP
jgi:hypothetical protein